MTKTTLKAKWNFSWAQLNLLIGALNTVIRQVQQGLPAYPDRAICWNWHHQLVELGYPNLFHAGPAELTVSLVEDLVGSWRHPRKTRCVTHPIGYRLGEELWTGEQREARLSLMRHITTRLRSWRKHQLHRELRGHLRQCLGKQYSQANLRLLRDSLRQVASQVDNHSLQLPTHGICLNWRDQIVLDGHYALRNAAIEIVSWASAYWPGSQTPGEHNVCPVPEDPGCGRWEGPQRVRRKHLIKFLLAQLEALSRAHEANDDY